MIRLPSVDLLAQQDVSCCYGLILVLYYILSPRLTKAFEVEMSRVFTLPVAYFTHIIGFFLYVGATMSL